MDIGFVLAFGIFAIASANSTGSISRNEIAGRIASIFVIQVGIGKINIGISKIQRVKFGKLVIAAQRAQLSG